MKLTDENKIEMYRLKKEGYSYKELLKNYLKSLKLILVM